MGFLWIQLNPVSLTCGLTAAEATQGKEQSKELVGRVSRYQKKHSPTHTHRGHQSAQTHTPTIKYS